LAVKVWQGPRYDTAASDPCTVSLLSAFAVHQRPKVIVEAGTYLGHMAISLALNLKQYDDVFHVWTADTTDYYVDGFDKPLKNLKLEKEITFFLGDFEEMLENVPPIDFAYIDASGADESTMRARHFKAAYRKGNKGALICIDDCAGDWPYAEKLKKEADIYLPYSRGLAIYQVK
jgi:predicted O-methyltransferase YrrM